MRAALFLPCDTDRGLWYNRKNYAPNDMHYVDRICQSVKDDGRSLTLECTQSAYYTIVSYAPPETDNG